VLGQTTSDVLRVTAQAQLGLAFSTVLTVGYQQQFTVTLIHIANATGNDRTVQLCAVPVGAAPAQANALLWDFTVPKNDFIEFGDGMILRAGWTIQGLASAANTISILVCGIAQ
jgi:hypothetical protein